MCVGGSKPCGSQLYHTKCVEAINTSKLAAASSKIKTRFVVTSDNVRTVNRF